MWGRITFIVSDISDNLPLILGLELPRKGYCISWWLCAWILDHTVEACSRLHQGHISFKTAAGQSRAISYGVIKEVEMETHQHQHEQPIDGNVEVQKNRLDRHGYLFGQKITHSLSPYLHQIIYDHLGLKWSQIRLDSADMSQFLQLVQHPSFYGTSESFYHQMDSTDRDRRLCHHAQQGSHPLTSG